MGVNPGKMFLPFILISFFMTGGCWEQNEELTDIEVITNRDYYPVFHHLIKNSEESVLAVIYLAKFHHQKESQVNYILEDLCDARSRGVNVKVLLDKSNWDSTLNEYNKEFIDSLEKYDVVSSFESPDVTTHAKCIVFDNRTALLGSTNWTTSALEYNNEVNIKVSNDELCNELTEYINGLWEEE